MGVGERRDAPLSLPQLIPGGMTRVASAVPLLNARPVPRGVHHDVQHPIPVVATLRWATGLEELQTVALEWWGLRGDQAVVLVRIVDQRVMTGAVWLPAADVRRMSGPRDELERPRARRRRRAGDLTPSACIRGCASSCGVVADRRPHPIPVSA